MMDSSGLGTKVEYLAGAAAGGGPYCIRAQLALAIFVPINTHIHHT